MISILCVILAAVPNPGPLFIAHSTAPTPAIGVLRAIGGDGAVVLAEPATTIAAGHLVSLRRVDRPLPPLPSGPQIVLVNGDRVAGDVTGGSDDALTFAPARSKSVDWSIPITSFAAVWIVPPPSDMPLDPASYPWNDAGKRRDAMLLRNGDVVRGVIEGMATEPAAVRIKVSGEATPQVVPLERVAALAFDPSLARPRKPKGAYIRIVTANGSRLNLRSATADGGTLRGTTLFGASLEVPVSDIVAFDVMNGKATYLSDLKPKRATVEPYNGVVWPWAADRSVKGEVLRLGPHVYDKGLGTHARTTLTYALTGKHRRFEATVGLDALSGRRGVVEVRILLDGADVSVPGLARLTARSSCVVGIDLGSAKELTLIVDYGLGGDVQDDVNWCDARLVE